MEFKNTIQCKGIEYHTTIKAVSDILTISITDPSNQTTWCSSYTSKNIEDLTAKTGNTKTFPIFCKLLTTALKGQNPFLHIDFYSYRDLETIRNGNSALAISSRPSKKKYLIISYITEFEKIHYPLPLVCQDSVPDKNSEVSKPNLDVLSENQKLKQENASLTKALSSYKEEFFNYRNKSERKIEELTGIKQELESEIQRMKEELDIIIAQLEEEAKKRNFNNNNDMKSLKSNLLREKEENNLLRSELSSCRKEVDLLRQRENSNKAHIEMLTKKLENCEDKSIDSPISADSPRNTPLRLSVSDSASLTNKNFEEFNSYVSKLHEVLKKNKTN